MITPKLIDAKRAHRLARGDTVMRAKLANAYIRAGGDDENSSTKILRSVVGCDVLI